MLSLIEMTFQIVFMFIILVIGLYVSLYLINKFFMILGYFITKDSKSFSEFEKEWNEDKSDQ
jgi:hypothetical protein